MGKGLAHAFKLRHPAMYEQYRKICAEGLLDVGKLWLWKGGAQWVLNFPTKRHWRYPSKIDFIERGLAKFVAEYEFRGITEIAFPRLGCGNGGLDWDEVRSVMEKYLSKLPINIYIHDFDQTTSAPEHVATSTDEAGATFHSFVCDIREIVSSSDVPFQTVRNRRKFTASIGDDNAITIATAKAKHSINEFDLFEFWLLLQKGPVGVNRMVGSVKNSGYYLLPIVSRLSYTRLILTSGGADVGALAIEITQRPSDILQAA